ncbi:MAG: methyltransferase domain-containing protein [Alphaproteobacteria bacterium]|nr:methyltransferase domain-containing protein [Alphaproteobacteria bacterium]
MQTSPAKRVQAAINKVVGPLGIRVVRNRHDWSDTQNFIPLKGTLAAAQKASLSVGDYIDTVMNNIPGATRFMIDSLHKLGVFDDAVASALEIGPGSGRYLEKIVEACRPARYEIYETAKPWANYLVSRHNVILQPTDGSSLAPTADASCDLVMAFKVFSSIPFMPTIRYWLEMQRVTRPGGRIVFDVMTEDCLPPGAIATWAASGINNGAYPAVMPRRPMLALFDTAGFALVGSFRAPMGVGQTETFVFRKT